MTADDTETQRVEAAARAMFAEEQCDRRQRADLEANWNDRLSPEDQDEYRSLARAGLAAARAAGDDLAVERAWDEGHRAGPAHNKCTVSHPNPYTAARIARTNPGEGGADRSR